MPPKASKATTPAAYAQAKRDAESAARSSLETLLSTVSSTKEYFSGDIGRDNTTYNPTTKALKAATNCIADLQAERDALEMERDALKELKNTGQVQIQAEAGRSDHSLTSNQSNKPSYAPITTQIAQPTTRNDLDIASLRQAARRCVAKAEEKMQTAAAAGSSATGQREEEELKEVLRQGYDVLVDITDMIEQGGMSEEMKRKWKEEQEKWGRKFWLQ